MLHLEIVGLHDVRLRGDIVERHHRRHDDGCVVRARDRNRDGMGCGSAIAVVYGHQIGLGQRFFGGEMIQRRVGYRERPVD